MIKFSNGDAIQPIENLIIENSLKIEN